MYRCASLTLAGAVAVIATAPAWSQTQIRNFPPNTLRGTIVFGGFPEVQLNGENAMLSPGTQIRDQNNRIVLPATLYGSKLTVNYTVGLNQATVQNVWLLRAEESAIRPWPRTLKEAQTWTYDATAHAWTKP